MPDAPTAILNHPDVLIQWMQYAIVALCGAIISLMGWHEVRTRRWEARHDTVIERCEANTGKAFTIVEANTTSLNSLRESVEDMVELERLRQLVYNKREA